MSSIEVRPFRRTDREQVTALVNAHAAAVVPGVSASVNAVLAQLEREPREMIVDPWVAERRTLVAEQRERVVAAAHLLRYADEERVGETYRGIGEIRWFLFWPEAPYWPDAPEAGAALLDACTDQLAAWRVRAQHADVSLPVPAVYGVPAQWPHVRAEYERAGFRHDGRTEVVWLADAADLPPVGEAPLAGLTIERSLGINGTRLAALLDGDQIGFIEVEVLGDAARVPRLGGLADIGNLHVKESHRRRGVATWLVAHAARWLRLAHVDRVLAYSLLEDEPAAAFLRAAGFAELTRTARGWTRG